MIIQLLYQKYGDRFPKRILDDDEMQLFVNSKNANTFTGIKGAQGLKEVANTLSKALTLKSSQSPKGVSDVIKITDLVFASTGVIGEDYPHTKIKNRKD